MADTEKEKNLKDSYNDLKNQRESMKSFAMSILGEQEKSIITSAKNAGVEVYFMQIGENNFIYRQILRGEYKKLTLDQARIAAQLSKEAEDEVTARVEMQIRSEEELVLKCLLYPVYDLLSIKELPAGYIQTLNEAIMSVSGFNNEPVMIKL